MMASAPFGHCVGAKGKRLTYRRPDPSQANHR
jgi:hypothetical protein